MSKTRRIAFQIGNVVLVVSGTFAVLFCLIPNASTVWLSVALLCASLSGVCYAIACACTFFHDIYILKKVLRNKHHAIACVLSGIAVAPEILGFLLALFFAITCLIIALTVLLDKVS